MEPKFWTISCMIHKKRELHTRGYPTKYLIILGPVVQSIISLTKSLVNDSLSLLVRLKSSVLIFFAEKM